MSAIAMRFTYPLVIKMEITSVINVQAGWKLNKVRGLILQDFWKQAKNIQLAICPHGTPRQVEILHQKTAIQTDEQMMECLKKTQKFEVIFKGHADSRN